MVPTATNRCPLSPEALTARRRKRTRPVPLSVRTGDVRGVGWQAVAGSPDPVARRWFSHELGAGDGDQMFISSVGEDAAEATSPSSAGVTCGVVVPAQLPRCVLNSPGRGAGLDALNTTIHDGRRWVTRQVAAATA